MCTHACEKNRNMRGRKRGRGWKIRLNNSKNIGIFLPILDYPIIMSLSLGFLYISFQFSSHANLYHFAKTLPYTKLILVTQHQHLSMFSLLLNSFSEYSQWLLEPLLPSSIHQIIEFRPLLPGGKNYLKKIPNLQLNIICQS